MKEYKHKGETFQLDDSKGCYATVTYKDLTGYVGVNLNGKFASDQYPYAWSTAEMHVTPEGVTVGNMSASFKASLDGLCTELLRIKATKTFDPEKYCAELHNAVKNLP